MRTNPYRGRQVPWTATCANAEDGRNARRIGRVTEGLLLRVAENVDIVEPVSKFTDPLHGRPGVRRIFNVGLEDWQPDEGVEYDLIWTQWCLGHLTDTQLISYLKVCKTVLRPESGIIAIKENLSTGSADMFDDTDGSVTRLACAKCDGIPKTPADR